MISKSIYPWQENAWQQLHSLRSRLPHALLFHGAAGIGKARFIEHVAQSLLCEAVQANGHACARCISCNWFLQQNHPDFRLVRPHALEDDAPPEGEGDAAGAEAKAAKSGKAPSKEIKIDQVRALFDLMNISTHRQGLRVIVLYPAEALNTPASNALLKMLEEPPPGSVFLLASNSLDRLLPTILSRCHKFALPTPASAEALLWLKAQGIAAPEDALREQGGAPLAALAQAQAQTGQRDDIEALLQSLARPSLAGALTAAEKLAKAPLHELVSCLQRWLYDLFALKMAGVIRYYPRYQQQLTALAQQVENGRLLDVMKGANQRRAIAGHPLSPKLFIEDMLLEYVACFK